MRKGQRKSSDSIQTKTEQSSTTPVGAHRKTMGLNPGCVESSSRYQVKTRKLHSGESLPYLIDTRTGSPMFEPTLFALKVLRAKGRASNTISQAMRSLAFLFEVLDALEIDLERRFREQRFLEMAEVEELVRLSRLRLKGLRSALRIGHARAKARPVVVRLESVRKSRAKKQLPEVDSDTSLIRLGYVQQYLKWLTSRRLMQMRQDCTATQNFLDQTRLVLGAIEAQSPPKSGARNIVGQREGLSLEEQNRLMDVIRPDSPENPWKGQHVRHRNQLLIHWILGLSLRRGEALGVQLQDISFRTNEVLIARRADNPDDPRSAPPLAKTNDRLLAIDGKLAELTLVYINKFRRKTGRAKDHKYLFVANGSGKPMSLNAAQKMMEQLRKKIPDLPAELNVHVLRHTWNERFSEQVREQGISPEDEQKWRSYQNGWRPGSRTASIYTRRHVREAAHKHSLAVQKAMVPTAVA